MRTLVRAGLAVTAGFFVASTVAPAQQQASSTTAQPANAPIAPTNANDSRAAKDIEAGATWFGVGNSKLLAGMDCARISTIEQGLQREANAYQRLGKGFDEFGKALTMVTALSQAAQGKYDDATQTMGEAAADKVVCMFLTVAACAGWNAGRAVGGVIKQFPWPGDPQGRTIEDVVTDAEVEFLLPYLDQPMNVRNMEATFAEFQRRQADLKRRQREAAEFGGQCKLKEEAEKRKNAVEEMLKKAKPPAVRSSSAADSYAEDLFGQSAAEATDPYAAQRLADEQNRKLGEADQIARDSNARAQRAAAAVWQQGLDALSAPTPSSPLTTHPLPNSAQPSGNYDQRRCIATVEMCAQFNNMTVEEYLRYDPPR